MSDEIMSMLVLRVCDQGFTKSQVLQEKCEIWNKSQRGCSKCAHFVERDMMGYVAVPPSAVKEEYLESIKTKQLRTLKGT